MVVISVTAAYTVHWQPLPQFMLVQLAYIYLTNINIDFKCSEMLQRLYGWINQWTNLSTVLVDILLSNKAN
jgi:hypothetical protein